MANEIIKKRDKSGWEQLEDYAYSKYPRDQMLDIWSTSCRENEKVKRLLASWKFQIKMTETWEQVKM